MKEFRTLKILDSFRAPLERLGVQFDELRLILQVKLTMDGRRAPTIASNLSSRRKKGTLLGGAVSSTSREEAGNSGNRFLLSLWMYALIGLVLIPFVLMGNNYMFQMSLAFGIIFFMVTSSLISDFSSVLLDIRDKGILLSRPLNSRTVNLAKMIHVLIYMSFITAAVTVPSLVVGLFKQGIGFFLLYLAEIVLLDFLIVAFTALLYFLVLRFFNGEKLKDIINYVQIGLTIGITLGYQLVFRLFDLVNFSLQFEPKWWQYLLPPVWFAGPFEVLLNGRRSGDYVAFALMALLIPIAALAVYIRLMPAFEQNLQKLSEQVGREKRRKLGLSGLLEKWMCRSEEEAVFFRFASIMMSRERDFKLKVYPSLGFSIIFPFIFLLTNLQDRTSFREISAGKSYLFIYFCALMVPTVVMMLKYSGKYKGAWIFEAIPVRNINNMYKGTLKAFLARLLIPLFLVDAVVFAAIFGVRIIPDLIAVLLCFLLYTYLSHLLLGDGLPFSEPFEVGQSTRGMKMLGIMAILAAFAFVHFVATRISYGVYIYMAVLLLANIFAWRQGFTDAASSPSKRAST